MNEDHPRFAQWDAAYVLGALSPADRRLFEAHLEQCAVCRGSIGEIAPTLGLLSRLTRDQAEAIPDEAGPDESARGRFVARAAQQARRRRALARSSVMAAAAAVVVFVVLAVAIAIVPALRGIQVVALEPVAAVPVTATVELVDAAWGTRIEVECSYDGDGADAPEDGWPYALVVTAADGTEEEVSTWRALPGATARVSAGTAVDTGDIVAIEIRAVVSGRVLMRADIPAG
ncbi:zf-HC2 domain-containing protein [Microbacter sp. GSS18]|nr:zf-HC2 domain-containing protein [Microbacter sp. GSS18]